MARTIPLTTPETRLTDVIRELERAEGPLEIEENGKTVAVLLSPSEYQAYARERAWQAIDDLRERNCDKSADEISRAVTEIVEEVRRERYEEKLAGPSGR